MNINNKKRIPWNKGLTKETSIGVMNISKSKIGIKNPMYNNGIHYHVGGYRMILCPEHPRKEGHYVMEHILIIEKHLGRYLTEKEVIHHINGIRNDNRLENLKLCKDCSEHMALHRGKDGKFKTYMG